MTKSPSRSPRASAASGCISSQECQVIFETGSGSSCIQGAFESSPAPKRGDGCTRSVRSPSPSKAGMSKESAVSGARSAGTSGAGASRRITPVRSASRQYPSKSPAPASAWCAARRYS